MAIEARRGKADALLAFPQANDPVGYHQRLSRELPVIAFYLYQAAGGVDYDDRTLHAILELPSVIGIKVATLDSIMTFQRIAAVLREHPTKLLITGEDRFLGYSLLLGARAALIGMGAALPDLQADLLRACLAEEWGRFVSLSELCDRFGQATFIPPMTTTINDATQQTASTTRGKRRRHQSAATATSDTLSRASPWATVRWCAPANVPTMLRTRMPATSDASVTRGEGRRPGGSTPGRGAAVGDPPLNGRYAS